MEKYHFIEKFEVNELIKLDNSISIIYRNYSRPKDLKTILRIKMFCKGKGIKFFLSNEIKLALKLDLDGVYLPSFNKCLRVNLHNIKKKFKLIGSAHNLNEIRCKEKQKIDRLFISSLFKNKRTFLGLNRFKVLSKLTKIPIIALGGINQNNLNKLNLLDIKGFAAISFFKSKKKGPNKRGPINF